ncbi:MAG TPA: hypothetical protein VKE51_39180 [Vicinamibacterales bacterium]|nr:hypothetical protein [Vicinamibacterales bacterium]
MSDGHPSAHVVVVTMSELEARGSQATAALAAYVRAEQTSTFRHLLCRRFAIAAAGWSLLGMLRVVPVVGVVVGLSLFVLIAAGAALSEHRARRRAHALAVAARESRAG